MVLIKVLIGHWSMKSQTKLNNGETTVEVEPGQPKYLEHYQINTSDTKNYSGNVNGSRVSVVLVDLMGHGDGPSLDSVGINSISDRMSIYVEQSKYITSVVKAFKEKIRPEKTYSFGHSLGGGCTINALLNYTPSTLSHEGSNWASAFVR